MTEPENLIGKELKRARMFLGFTMNHTARRSGISEACLCQVEKGKARATPLVLDCVGKFLELPRDKISLMAAMPGGRALENLSSGQQEELKRLMAICLERDLDLASIFKKVSNKIEAKSHLKRPQCIVTIENL